MARARVKTLFDSGDYDPRKPGTFLVRLRRWRCGLGLGGVVDYILETTIVSDEPFNTSSLHKETEFKRCLEVSDDNEAIRTAVMEYQKLDGLFKLCKNCTYWQQDYRRTKRGECKYFESIPADFYCAYYEKMAES